MRSYDLSRDPTLALKNKLQPMLGYLNRLKHRMIRKGFPPDDPLLTAARRAEDAMHALQVETHYLACWDVTGRSAMTSPAEIASRRA
jgi:hypothetical protein